MEAINDKDDLLRLLARLEYGYQLLANEKMDALLTLYQEQIEDYGRPGHAYRKVFDVRNPPDLETDFGEPLPGAYLKGLVERYNNKALTEGEKEALLAFRPFRGHMGEFEGRAAFDKAVREARSKKNQTAVEDGRYPFATAQEIVDFLQDYLLGLRVQRKVSQQDAIESALKKMQRAKEANAKRDLWNYDVRALLHRYEDRTLGEEEKETLRLGVQRRKELLAGAREDDFYEDSEEEEEGVANWLYRSSTYPVQVQSYLNGEETPSTDKVVARTGYWSPWLKFPFLEPESKQKIALQEPNTFYELLALDLSKADKKLIFAVDGFQERPQESDLHEVLKILDALDIFYGEVMVEGDHLHIATTAGNYELETRLDVFIRAHLEPRIYFLQCAAHSAPLLINFK